MVALSTADEFCVPITVAGAVGMAVLGGYAWLGRKIDRYESWMREESARKDKLYDDLMASVQWEANRERH